MSTILREIEHLETNINVVATLKRFVDVDSSFRCHVLDDSVQFLPLSKIFWYPMMSAEWIRIEKDSFKKKLIHCQNAFISFVSWGFNIQEKNLLHSPSHTYSVHPESKIISIWNSSFLRRGSMYIKANRKSRQLSTLYEYLETVASASILLNFNFDITLTSMFLLQE